MSKHLPVIGGIVVGVLVGLGVTHWSQERAADAALRAPMVLSTDVPAAQARGSTGAGASLPRTQVRPLPADRGRPLLAASQAGVYVLRGDTLRRFDVTTLRQRKRVSIPAFRRLDP